MSFLLDTSAFIIWMSEPDRLSSPAASIITNPSVKIYFSVVSIWEMEIKIALGRLPYFGVLKPFLDSDLRAQRFEVLDVTRDHAHRLATLPSIHQDPFDRLLISQAVDEKHTIITKDSKFNGYPVPLLW